MSNGTPTNGQWYQATDGKWYCWPNPTPYEVPPAPPSQLATSQTVGQHAWSSTLDASKSGSPTDVRPFYKKKRYIIPAAIVSVGIVSSAFSGGNNGNAVKASNSADSSPQTVVTAPAKLPTPAERAAAARAAAAQAADAKASAEAAAKQATAEKAAAAKAAAAKVAVEKAAAAKAAAAKAAAGTVAQQNAAAKAADYLDYTAFSRSELIKQLEFDGFSPADATWGVDKRHADWNEQAAAKAKDYLNYTSFSRSGLIEQLEFDGFTSSQASYGASTTGL